jgi:hypothetical protein
MPVGDRPVLPFIVCTDDDCYPEENYLDSIFECFSNDPKLGFVGGRILLHDPADPRITIQESLEPLFFSAGQLYWSRCYSRRKRRLPAGRSCRGRWLRSMVWSWSTLQRGGSGIVFLLRRRTRVRCPPQNNKRYRQCNIQQASGESKVSLRRTRVEGPGEAQIPCPIFRA